MVIFYQFEIWKLAIVLEVIRAKVKKTWIKTTIYDALLIRMHIIEVQRFLRIVLFLSLHHCGPFGRPCKDGKMPMRERGDMEVSHIRSRMGGNATQSINRRCWCWTMARDRSYWCMTIQTLRIGWGICLHFLHLHLNDHDDWSKCTPFFKDGGYLFLGKFILTLMTTRAFSQNISKSFSKFKLVT